MVDQVERRQKGKKIAASDGIQECIENIQDIRANNQQEEYLRGLDQKILNVESITIRLELLNGTMVTASQMFLKVGMATTVLAGAALLSSHSIGFMMFLMFMVASTRLYGPLTGCLQNLSAVYSALLVVERMKGIEEQPVQQGSREAAYDGYDIVFDHVDKAYTTYGTDIVLTGETRPSRTRQVLRDLSLTIPAGEITVIVGRSGCGKSTLLKLLAGTEMPDTGTIRIPEGWHSAMLSPDPYVITWTSVQRNVAMACGVGKTPEERYERASEFVRLVGLEDYADLTPVELSTGMKQRLGLARVLAGQAELLLMDEPFASLDFLTRAELQSQLLAIQEKLPRTIVLVTHQLEEALLLGRRIIVMHPDSTICEFDLTDLPYPRDLDDPTLRRLKKAITDQCRYTA